MIFGWFQSLMLGIITGFAEILPVSAEAHNRIVTKLMGKGDANALLMLFIHLGILTALYAASHTHILKMMRAKKMSRIPKRKRKRPLDTRSLMDLKLLTTMMAAPVLMLLVWPKVAGVSSNMIVMATMLFVNGLVLYIPQFLPSSNKDCRTLSRVEGLLMGVGGALYAIPGLSGVGAALSAASVTGVERKYGLQMVLMMQMAVMGGFIVYDLLDVLGNGVGYFSGAVLLWDLLAAAAAFAGASLAIRILRHLAEEKGFGAFAYYSWGLALFTFIFNLMA